MADFKIADDLKNAATIHNPLGYFREINTFIFDVDGVMTDGKLLVTEGGEFLRAFNAKDGYAIRRALEENYNVCVITGGRGNSIEYRMKKLGVSELYVSADPKLPVYERYLSSKGLQHLKVLYMGDDLNDFEIMEKVGLPCCPADACPEIMSLCHYVSPFKGGEGCVRDVIEKVMKIHGKWMNHITTSG